LKVNRLTEAPHGGSDLRQIYETRFAGRRDYRGRVWAELGTFFARWIDHEATVLDLGAGYCEFINSLKCGRKFAMDLNPDAQVFADSDVTVLPQNCAEQWGVPAQSLDVVFTSNFFEHLATKADLESTLKEAHNALVRDGRLIAIGPNIKYVPGAYWDFFDHYLPLTELSLSEVLKKCGFAIEYCRDRFLPYTMSNGVQYPVWMLSVYLKFPPFWPLFGKQFLLVARKTG
jgi:SAM-dependent methyltransferase